MASWWLLAQHRDKNHLQCYCKYNLSHLHKPSWAQMRKFRMEAETLLLPCIWAGHCCALTRCQTADVQLISNPLTSPNINQHYSDVKNAMWSRLCLRCYSCLIGPIAPILTMLILWKCLFPSFLSASHLLHFISALLNHNNSHCLSFSVSWELCGPYEQEFIHACIP